MQNKNENAAGGSGASNPIPERDIENTTDHPVEMQAAALSFAKSGLPIFPCRSKDKVPLTTNGYKAATTDIDQIDQWWTANPDANIGLPTGKISALWVLDIDTDKGGEESLKKLIAEHSDLPESRQVITGGGGRHIYFSWPDNGIILNSVNKLGSGLDIRGQGGYVIAPPSIHASGKRYRWSESAGDTILSAPPWLLTLIQQGNNQKTAISPTEWRELLREIPDGGRNDTITRLSGKLLGARLDPHMTLQLCLAVNESRCKPPLHEDEVWQIVNSIAGRELKKQGGKNNG